MGTRNTTLLQEIIEVVSPEASSAPDRLETHFQERLIVDAGNITTVGAHANYLRLNITTEECAAVLDYIAEQKMVVVTVDHVETAVWELLGKRFVGAVVGGRRAGTAGSSF